ncbi:MAG: hypothetical protein COB20_09910 [SAR86 cluster bacterium]|uniref:ABC transporter permease n=1 Tax=SAR86 cluster bacterium TaxID=2030880 RepID=A0A2A4X2H0_9GAMM|nr:MAG: hypothetical protein COB20_09910 [SAR86 cluster bacterium]
MNSWFELRYTLRLMRRKLGFTTLCIAVISLGIAVSLLLIFMAKVIGLEGLPFENGDRFVIIREGTNEQNNVQLDSFSYSRIAQIADSYEQLGAYREIPAVFTDGETAESFNAARISPNLLAITNVPPLLGRSLQAVDDSFGAIPVALISYELWQSYYAGSENILGQQSRINGELYSIVGVMPEDFRYPKHNDLWLPLQLEPNQEPGGSANLTPIGLLKEGVDLAAAEVEVNAILQSVNEQFSDIYRERVGFVKTFSQIFTSAMRFVPLLVGLAISILSLVCLNVSNLLIVRSNERIAELAVRTAVGGTRWRTIRQVLMESLLICVIGAFFGLIIGGVGLALLEYWMASSFELPFWLGFSVEKSDVVIVFAAAIFVWALSGFYPAWTATRQDISGVLNHDGKAAGSVGSGRLTRLLVSAEVVISCFLLIICWVFVAFVYRANQVDFGVDAENLLAGRVDLNSSEYSSSEGRLRFLDELKIELLGTDVFESSAYANVLVGEYPGRYSYTLLDQEATVDNRAPEAGMIWVSENYLNLIGANLIAGRSFSGSDNEFSSPVVIVDQLFAEKHWPGEFAVGRQINLGVGQQIDLVTVIGVINQLIYGEPDRENLSRSSFYRPLAQLPFVDSMAQYDVTSMAMVLKVAEMASAPLADFEKTLKLAVNRVDRNIPVRGFMPLSQVTEDRVLAWNFMGTVFLLLSMITFVLSAIGIYGVVSRSVQLRTKEIGIRRALGSTDFSVISIFLKQGAVYLSLGLVLGGSNAILALGAVLGTIDTLVSLNVLLWVVVGVLFSLSLLIILASYIPARRAIKYEPGEALHYG